MHTAKVKRKLGGVVSGDPKKITTKSQTPGNQKSPSKNHRHLGTGSVHSRISRGK